VGEKQVRRRKRGLKRRSRIEGGRKTRLPRRAQMLGIHFDKRKYKGSRKKRGGLLTYCLVNQDQNVEGAWQGIVEAVENDLTKGSRQEKRKHVLLQGRECKRDRREVTDTEYSTEQWWGGYEGREFLHVRVSQRESGKQKEGDDLKAGVTSR